MPAKAAAVSRPIQLKFEEGGRKVVVEPDDRSSYRMLVRQVIDACHLWNQQIEAQDRLTDELLPRLQKWVTEHAQHLDSAFLAPRDTGLLFVIMCNGPYDWSLEDPLTDLDVQLASEFPDFWLDVLETPLLDDDGLEAFVPAQRLVFDISPAE